VAVEQASEQSAARSVAELFALSQAELENLWEGVPTEYQDTLKRRYTQILRAKGVTDDIGELELIKSYLNRYETEGLIPAGDKWLKISPAARKEFQLDLPENEIQEEGAKRSRQPLVLIGGLLVGAALMLLLLTRLFSGSSSEMVAAAGTPTATTTISRTPTATVIPTETPLALVDADTYISDSDNRANRNFYPVVFRVVPPNRPPRVFVVQERLVATTEWQYESNPDVASWLSGMLVHPVLGIPYNSDNLQFLESLEADTDFILRMNTGAELVFRFDGLRQMARDDTVIFSQLRPGIAVVLIGQRGIDGLPTPLRLVAVGSYTPTQELENLAQNIVGLPVPQGQSASVEGLNITVADVERQADGSEYAHLRITLQLESLASNINLDHYQWLLEDDNGLQYTARSRAFTASTIEMGTHVVSSISFRVPARIADGSFVVVPASGAAMSFALAMTTPATPLTLDAVDIQLRFVERDDRHIYLAARIFNPTASTFVLAAADVWLVSGYVPDPPGPLRHPLDFAPLTLEPNQVWDTEWRFDWNGSDPYAAFGIAGRHYTVTLHENR
jgi:hypothetical protein